MRFLVLAVLISNTFPAFATRPASSVSQQSSPVYVCPMHPEVQSSTPGKCPKCEMKLVLQTSPKPAAVNQADSYTCPMHPEIRSDKTGQCPKCGMSLIPADPGIPEDFDLTIECTPRAIKPAQPIRLRFVVVNPKTRVPVKQFALMHEKLFHLFIVSQDLSEFQHIHPELQPDGSFTIQTVLPREGVYKIYADFYPVDGNPQVLQRSLVTAGYHGDLFRSIARINPGSTMAGLIDGTKVELKLDPVSPIAGKPVTLKYHLVDENTGEPVKDLRPYLGAWGHTLILSEDQTDYVHSHPSELVPESTSVQTKGGPDITFEALLPRPGNYRVWTQFQRGETLSTIRFDLRADVLR
ncbi:MAG TPA: heavy metal-binding domain-containing protein [Blastocatellia bacterium]|nr:heavy metal-binding domain-containing protein [Blastocatellia bacterium]